MDSNSPVDYDGTDDDAPVDDTGPSPHPAGTANSSSATSSSASAVGSAAAPAAAPAATSSAASTAAAPSVVAGDPSIRAQRDRAHAVLAVVRQKKENVSLQKKVAAMQEKVQRGLREKQQRDEEAARAAIRADEERLKAEEAEHAEANKALLAQLAQLEAEAAALESELAEERVDGVGLGSQRSSHSRQRDEGKTTNRSTGDRGPNRSAGDRGRVRSPPARHNGSNSTRSNQRDHNHGNKRHNGRRDTSDQHGTTDNAASRGDSPSPQVRGREAHRSRSSSSAADSGSPSRSRQVEGNARFSVADTPSQSVHARPDVPSLGFRLAGLQISDHADRLRRSDPSVAPSRSRVAEHPGTFPVDTASHPSVASSSNSRTEHLLEEMLVAMRAPRPLQPDLAEMLAIMRAQPQHAPTAMQQQQQQHTQLPQQQTQQQPQQQTQQQTQPPQQHTPHSSSSQQRSPAHLQPAQRAASTSLPSPGQPWDRLAAQQPAAPPRDSGTSPPLVISAEPQHVPGFSDDDRALPLSSTGARERQAAAEAAAASAEADRLLRIRDQYFKIKPEQLDSIPSLPLGSNIDDFSHFAKSATSVVTEVLERGDPDRLQTFASSVWAPGWLPLLRKRVRSAVLDPQGTNRPLLEFIDATFQQVEAALRKNQDGPAAFKLFLGKLAEAWAPVDDTSGIDRLRSFGVASHETYGEYMRRFKALVATVMVSHHAFKPSSTQVQIAVRDSMRRQFPSLLSQLMTDNELDMSSPFGTSDDCLEEMWARLDRKAMAHTHAINGSSY